MHTANATKNRHGSLQRTIFLFQEYRLCVGPLYWNPMPPAGDAHCVTMGIRGNPKDDHFVCIRTKSRSAKLIREVKISLRQRQ